MKWEKWINNERKSYNIYFSNKVDLKYKYFSNKRDVMKIWHQARLKVIPTFDHLFKINCCGNKFCPFDNNVETNIHMLVECKEYNKIITVKINKITSQEKIKELLDENNDDKFKERIAIDILKVLKHRNKEIHKLENDNKSLIIYEGNRDYEQGEEDSKYDSKETRISKFKQKNKNFVECKENLSTALVPFIHSGTINSRLRLKRPRLIINIENNNVLKRRRIVELYISTIICCNKKIIDNKKYISKAKRIERFRKRGNMDRKKDLSKALVPYTWNKNYQEKTHRIKRQRVVIDIVNLIKLKKTKIETQNVVTLAVWKGKFGTNKIREDPKYMSKHKKIEFFRNRHRLTKEIKEDLSKAIVKYVHNKGRDNNRTRRIKRIYSSVDIGIFINFKKRRVEEYFVKTLVIYKGNKLNTKNNANSVRMKIIREFKKRRSLRDNPPEDLSKALVPYKFKRKLLFNKAKKRKRRKNTPLVIKKKLHKT